MPARARFGRAGGGVGVYHTAMPTWTLDAIERQALEQRFVRYVKIDTQSDENSSCSPSTEKQKDLARLPGGRPLITSARAFLDGQQT